MNKRQVIRINESQLKRVVVESVKRILMYESQTIANDIDKAYMDAVSRGDMKTAQQMVIKAAKMAMPNTKVIGDDGEPLIVYHGTPNGGFTEFNTKEGGTSKTKWQLLFGSHFTLDKNQANEYTKQKKTGKIYPVFLSINNPIDLTKKGEHIAVSRKKDVDGADEWGYEKHPEIVDKLESLLSKRVLKKYAVNDSYSSCYNLWNLLNNIPPKDAYSLILSLGFDGVKYDARYQYGPVASGYVSERTDESWIALKKNQIKSAEPVAYDDQGNIIPLSERFNLSNNDIRYEE